MVVNYFEVRQKIALALKRAGFRVKSPFKLPLGWIDVAAFKKDSIGIDLCISNTSNSFKKLSSYPFKYRIVLDLGNESEKQKRYVVLANLDELKDFISETFDLDINFDVELPRAHVEFIKNYSKKDVKLGKMLNALIFMYASKEVLEEKMDEYYKDLKALTPLMKMLNLVVSSSKETVRPRTHFMYLSLTGSRIAKSALIEKIMTKEQFFNELIKKYGKEKIYIVFSAIQRDLSLKLDDVRSLEIKNTYQNFLLKMRNVDIEPIINKIVSHKYAQTSLSIFCYILTYTTLYDTAIKTMEELETLGLACKVPVYSPYGIQTGYEYRIPAEVVDYILKITNAEIDEDLINEIVILSLLLKIRINEIEILQNIGIPLERIDEIKDMLVEKNLLDENKLKDSFKNFLRVKIAKTCEEIL
ncbi:hypothetical protein DRO97_04340 [Archaeoglobales archaeon]|nr:MAG: hypothetical protein DRO97_04340 [Archaeoglobales archaeon]